MEREEIGYQRIIKENEEVNEEMFNLMSFDSEHQSEKEDQ
jgi:hypothetical protein